MIVTDEQLGAKGIADGDGIDSVAGMTVAVDCCVGLLVGMAVNVAVGASVGGGGAAGVNN